MPAAERPCRDVRTACEGVTGSAAEFNGYVSLSPPRSSPQKSGACSRRPEGYTASSSASLCLMTIPSNKQIYPFLYLYVLLFCGCASVPQSSDADDKSAKQFSPPSDKANIYLYRRARLHGAAHQVQVLLDGRVVGATASGTYLLLTVAPGNHTVSSMTESIISLPLKTQSGNCYFVEQKILSGGWARPPTQLNLVENEEGKSEVLKCKMTPLIPNTY